MHDENLITYMNDHVAGSVVATQLIENWQEAEIDEALAVFLGDLLAEIREDVGTLQSVLERVGGSPSKLKNASAWISEKLGRLKLVGTGDSGPAWGFYRLEQFDLLIVGVRGKQALWDALEAAAADDPRLMGYDWAALSRRAQEQIRSIEVHRLQSARLAFRGTPLPLGGRGRESASH